MWHTSTSPQAARATNIKNPIFLEDVPALAVPFVVTSEKRNVPGWSVAWLDRNFIVENLLPKLFESHFAVSDPPPYRIAIVSAERPHRVIYQSEPFSGEDLSSADLMVDLLPEVDGKLKRIGPQAIHIIAPETPQWRLVVKHRLGSVDAAVENLRSRNLGIGLGILCVLAAAVGLVLVAASRARSLARAQLEFAAAVSHELRTPLAVIRAAAYNLEEGIAVDRPRVRYYASLIKDAGRRLSKMVDQVLLFAETQSKERRIEVRSVPVAEVIENALDSVAATIVCDQWKAEKFIEPDLPPVLADPVLLSHCLQNILNNALKYGKVTHITPVKIMATRDLKKPEVQISVSDEGPGIDASDLPHIFNPFYRGINVEPDMAGSGLGLALVRRLMSIQNGDVSVKTGEHGGCTFVLRIPADGMKK